MDRHYLARFFPPSILPFKRNTRSVYREREALKGFAGVTTRSVIHALDHGFVSHACSSPYHVRGFREHERRGTIFTGLLISFSHSSPSLRAFALSTHGKNARPPPTPSLSPLQPNNFKTARSAVAASYRVVRSRKGKGRRSFARSATRLITYRVLPSAPLGNTKKKRARTHTDTCIQTYFPSLPFFFHRAPFVRPFLSRFLIIRLYYLSPPSVLSTSPFAALFQPRKDEMKSSFVLDLRYAVNGRETERERETQRRISHRYGAVRREVVVAGVDLITLRARAT